MPARQPEVDIFKLLLVGRWWPWGTMARILFIHSSMAFLSLILVVLSKCYLYSHTPLLLLVVLST